MQLSARTVGLRVFAVAAVLDTGPNEADGMSPVLALADRFGLIDGIENPGPDLLRAAMHPEEALAIPVDADFARADDSSPS